MVCVFIKLSELDMTIEEEHFAEFSGLIDIDVLKWGGVGGDLIGERDSHSEFVAADREGDMKKVFVTHVSISPLFWGS